MDVKELLNAVYSDAYLPHPLDSVDSYYLYRLYANWGEDFIDLYPEQESEQKLEKCFRMIPLSY